MQTYNPITEFPNLPKHDSVSSCDAHQPGPELDAPEPAPFPTAALPPAIGNFVCAVAEALRIPAALPACCALAATSAAIGRGLALVSGPEGQRTPANLFILASADSGSGKSRVFKEIIQPLLDYECTQLEAWRAKDGAGRRREAQEIILNRLIEERKKTISLEMDEETKEQTTTAIADAKAQLDELKKLIPPRMIIQDTTIEALGVRLAECGETLFSACADARKLADNLLGRNNPGKMVDDSVYLQAFSGDPIVVDRQSRETLILRAPCLTLLWLVQPDILEKMLAEAALQTGGFLARTLLCHTLAVPQEWSWATSPLTDATREQWARLLTDLVRSFHDSKTVYDVQVPRPVWEQFRDYQNPLVARVRGEMADVKSYAMRWTEQAMRLSLVFHAAIWGPEAPRHDLAVETAEAAISVVRWFADQQLQILARGRQEARQKLEDRVLELIEERQVREQLDHVTVRFIQNRHVVRTAEEAEALLDRMVTEHVLVREEVRRATGGHVERRYRRSVSSTASLN